MSNEVIKCNCGWTGTASEATEDQARGIVEPLSIKDEMPLQWFGDFPTAVESLHSLIRSLGMEPETTLILRNDH